MPRLIDTYAREDVYAALGMSPIGRIKALEDEVQELRRIINRLRIPQGVNIEDRYLATFDADGYLTFNSSNGSITITDAPAGNPHSVDWVTAA